MTKVLCSCGFSGNLEDLKIRKYPKAKSILICPECNSSGGLDFAVEGSGLDKPVKEPHQKGVDENITTEEDFELFKKCVMYWIKHFGLYGWDIHMVHQEDDTSLAFTRYNVLNRSATIVLAKNWGDRVVSDIQIDKSAFHEIGEVLMLRIRFIADARFVTEEEAGEEIHNIIRTLEKVIWEPKIRDLNDRVASAAKIMEDTIEKNIIKIRSNTIKEENVLCQQ